MEVVITKIHLITMIKWTYTQNFRQKKMSFDRNYVIKSAKRTYNPK